MRNANTALYCTPTADHLTSLTDWRTVLFLLELNYWLEKQKHIVVTSIVDGKELSGEITKMSCANAMLFAVPTGNVNDGVTYQLQIYAEYTIESEEF